jgi:hypothetical protein
LRRKHVHGGHVTQFWHVHDHGRCAMLRGSGRGEVRLDANGWKLHERATERSGLSDAAVRQQLL